MEQKILTYDSDDIKVTYDVKRCIHAKECVKGLRTVFNPDKQPWVQPQHEEADTIAEIVERCPTGALQYERKDDNGEESVPPINTISVVPDGPVYLRGDIEMQDHEGNILLKDTRMGLCRCGASENKPVCDNTHTDISFEAPASLKKESVTETGGQSGEENGKLVLQMMQNGPVLVSGTYWIYSDTTQPVKSSKNIALCRCGASDNKPFCDGSHKEIGFEAS